MLTGTSDLDDVDAVTAADVDGFLRAAASAGAQVRAVASAVDEGVLAPLAQIRPRAVVVVAAPGTPMRAARLVSAGYAAHVDTPITVVSAIPSWIGPLDVVVVCGDDAGDRGLADAVARGVRRRAEVVVAVPFDGPVADAAGADVIDLSPRVRVAQPFRFAGHVAALVAVITALPTARVSQRTSLHDVADNLDAQALATHPDREVFHNTAKSLALRVNSADAAWSGDSEASLVVAEHAGAVMLAVAGMTSAASTVNEAVQGSMVGPRADASSTAALFHDPDFDPPLTPRRRVYVITTAAREWSVAQRVSAIEDVDVIATSEVAIMGDSAGVVQAMEPGGAAVGDTPADVDHLVVIAARIEMAAVYVRLMGDR